MAVTHGSGMGGGSAISGAGANNEVTLWTGPATLGGRTTFTWDDSSGAMVVGIGGVAGGALQLDTTGSGVRLDTQNANFSNTYHLGWCTGAASGLDPDAGFIRDSIGIMNVEGYPGTLGHLAGGVLSVEHPAAVAAVVTPNEAANGVITTIAVATQSTGLITCVAKALLLDGETVSVTDAIGGLVTYEFDLPPDGVGGGNIVVDVSAAVSAADVAAVLAPLIQANNTDLTVLDNLDGTISLTAGTYGVAGSITLADTVAAGGFSAVAVAGVAGIMNDETVVIDDGVNPATTFRFQVDGQVIGAGTAVPVLGGDVADTVRDNIITAVNGVGATLAVTATNGGAATVNLELDAPGAGGVNSETVIAGGFGITGMTVGGASTWGYTIVAKLNDGSVSIGAETQTATGPDDLDANDYITITWVDNPLAYAYDIYRTTVAGPPSALTTGLVAADIAGGVQTFDDTGIAAGAAIPTVDTTGQVRFYDSGGNYVAFRASETIAANQNFIWPTAAPAVGEALVAATVTGTEIQLDWASAAVTYYTKTLTGGAATDFLDVTVAANTGLGGKLVYEVEAINDAAPVERNIITGELAFTSLNKNAATLYTDLTDRQDSNVETNATALTLVWAYTNNVGAAKFTISCNASSTLAGVKTYTLRYQVVAPKALTVAAV